MVGVSWEPDSAPGGGQVERVGGSLHTWERGRPEGVKAGQTRRRPLVKP